MNKLSTDQLKNIIISVLLMVIGILFCCSLAMGINGLSVIIGVILLVVGILFLIANILNSKEMLSTGGLIGAVITTLGIMFIVHKLATIIFAFIPWFLIIIGLVILTDALLGKFLRNEDNLLMFVIKIVVGTIALILGICLLAIDGFAEYASIILGILMIAYSVYLIYLVFSKNTNKAIN